jgi:hypothetical protein
MSRVRVANFTVSLDGYGSGVNQRLDPTSPGAATGVTTRRTTTPPSSSPTTSLITGLA